MKRLCFLILLIFAATATAGPPSSPVQIGTASDLTTGSDTTPKTWSPKTLSDEFSGASAEVVDATVGVAGDADTNHAYSKDDLHDYFIQFDTDLDALLSDEAWLTTYMTEAEFTTAIGAAYDTSAELDALFGAKQGSLTFGIADDNAVEVDGSPGDGEVAVWTANGLNGLSEAEFKAAYNMEAATDFLAPAGDGSALTGVDAATGDSATAFFDAGTIEAARLPDVSGTTDGIVPTTSGVTDDWVLTKQGDGSAAWADPGSGTDSAAIHDDTAGEIVAVTEKTYTVANDELLIEDSEDSNAKKSVKVSNLNKTSGIGDTVPFYDTDAATKKIQFDAGNTTAGNTRVFGFPDANGTVATIAATQTLTNKTIDGDDNTIQDIGASSLKSTAVYTATASKSAAYTIGTDDAKEAYGGVIYVTSAATVTAPAVVAGMSFTVITIGATAVSLDVNASDKMYLDGVLLDDGDKATNTSTTGDIITCSYYSADGWYCASGSPDGDQWTDGS